METLVYGGTARVWKSMRRSHVSSQIQTPPMGSPENLQLEPPEGPFQTHAMYMIAAILKGMLCHKAFPQHRFINDFDLPYAKLCIKS